MWNKLRATYERQLNVSTLLSQRQIFHFKFKDNLMDFVSKIQNLTSEIKQQNGEISEKINITKLLKY